MYLEGDENASAAAAGASDSVSESNSDAPAAGAQDNQQPKAVDPPAGEQAGNATQATAPAGDGSAATPAAATPASPTPNAPTPAAPPAPAAAEQGDPGDENPEPITAAKDSVEVTVAFGEFEAFRHVFVPNSTPFIRSLSAVIKAKELADLEALAKTGEISVSVNGAVVDHTKSSLELGVGDGARISITA